MSNATILIIDDDPNITLLLGAKFKQAGFTVITADNGKQGLESLATDRPALIILDVTMPEMSGWDVGRAIRNNPAYDDIKIIMLTARDTVIDKLIGNKVLHVDAYITKPFNFPDVLETVTRLLAGV